MFAKVTSRVGASLTQFSRKLTTSGDISYTVFETEETKIATPIVLAHGALGNKKNFNTLAKRLSDELNRSVITYDARNHGKSMHSNDMSLEAMSSDLEHLLHELGKEKCILIGHSLGGRTSMFTALHKPELIEDLIVVDMPIQFDRIRKNSSIRFLEAMQTINLESSNGSISKARMITDRQLKPHIRDDVIRQFILTNLEKSSETSEIGWRCNVDALLDHFKDPDVQIVTPSSQLPYQQRCLFICGGNSTYVNDDDVYTIKQVFPQAQVTHIPQAGHWVHFERPNEFFNAVREYLQPHKRWIMSPSIPQKRQLRI